MSTSYPLAEDNMQQGAYRESCCDPARSETLSMPGSYSHRSWEVSSVPDGALSGGAGKGNRNSAIDADEKSDASIVPKKPPNNRQVSPPRERGMGEEGEGGGAAKGTAEGPPAIPVPRDGETCLLFG